MPRLTNQRYLLIHHQLRLLWLEAPEAFAYLNPTEQWQLHDYFRPSKDLTGPKLLTHRTTITTQRPSLPHQAGRALAKLYRIAEAGQVRKLVTPIGNRRFITVYGLVNPDLDLEALAQVLLDIARHLDDDPPEPGQVETHFRDSA